MFSWLWWLQVSAGLVSCDVFTWIANGCDLVSHQGHTCWPGTYLCSPGYPLTHPECWAACNLRHSVLVFSLGDLTPPYLLASLIFKYVTFCGISWVISWRGGIIYSLKVSKMRRSFLRREETISHHCSLTHRQEGSHFQPVSHDPFAAVPYQTSCKITLMKQQWK